MVRAYTPQNSLGNIDVNTNYPPQQFDEPGGTLTFNDETYVIGGQRGSVAYVIGGQRGKVDYEDLV